MPSQVNGKYLRYILHFRTEFKSCLPSETHHRGEIELAAFGHTTYRALGGGEFPYLRLIRCDHENTAKAQTSLNRRFCLGAKSRAISTAEKLPKVDKQTRFKPTT